MLGGFATSSPWKRVLAVKDLWLCIVSLDNVARAAMAESGAFPVRGLGNAKGDTPVRGLGKAKGLEGLCACPAIVDGCGALTFVDPTIEDGWDLLPMGSWASATLPASAKI